MNPVDYKKKSKVIETVNDDGKKIPRVEYNKKEKEQLAMIQIDADHAATQKQQRYIELDDMDYETWYVKAKKASQAYIRPKENEEDVKVVTGTTREKGNTIVSMLLGYNLECDITAFDEDDNENRELGDAMEKMVRKSRELELPRYDVKKPLIYNELVYQGNAFVRESWDEYSMPEKELEKMEWSEKVELDKIKWKERIDKVYAFCNTTLLTGLEVYPGNIRQYFMELQPYVITRKVITYSEAKSMFSGWERFKYVSDMFTPNTDLERNINYDDYQMIETEVKLVEFVQYYNKWTNTYQILLNGTLMLPVGFPMSAITGVCEYPISKGDGEMISPNFFFSRGIGAKTKMDQAILDEMFKMMIIKTRKSYKPPLANKGNYDIGPSVYMPGKIFKNIDPDKLKPIGDNLGVTPAEFDMTRFVKEIIDGKSISPIMEGQAPDRQVTARQIIEQKQQSMMKLGGIMLGILNLEQRMAWMRIYNILRHWTDVIDTRISGVKGGVENMYRTISVEDTLENGRKGEKIIDFTENIPTDEQVLAEEDLLSDIRNKPVRKVYIHPKMLRNLKYKWNVLIVPTEKNSDHLKAAVFEEFLTKVFTLFLPVGKVPNIDYLADRFAQVNNEDADQVWQQTSPEQQAIQGIMGPVPTIDNQQQGLVTSQMTPNKETKPSLNAMLNT